MKPIGKGSFSSIGEKIINCMVLDLFAGSGSYGLEALSRGAKSVTFVEKNRSVIKDLKINAANTLKSAQLESMAAKIEARDVLEFLKNKSTEAYDIIFLDHPTRSCPKLFSLYSKGCINSPTRTRLWFTSVQQEHSKKDLDGN